MSAVIDDLESFFDEESVFFNQWHTVCNGSYSYEGQKVVQYLFFGLFVLEIMICQSHSKFERYSCATYFFEIKIWRTLRINYCECLGEIAKDLVVIGDDHI